jgi:ABC-2 type transport system permease protein
MSGHSTCVSSPPYPIHSISGALQNVQADVLSWGWSPINFLAHMLARNVGEATAIVLLRGLSSFLFACLVLGIQLPADLIGAAAFGVSVALGYVVSFGVSFLMGLLPLVSHDIHSYNWAFSALIRFAWGEAIPLRLFPPLLGAVVAALPFQAIYFVPMSLYVGAHQGSLAQALLAQALWALGVLGFCQFAWLEAQRRIVV